MAPEYGGVTALSHPLVVEVILPFLLVFTVVFGVLQKSEIFGKGKKQIDAIVALVIGLLVISFAKAVGIIVQMTAFLAVLLVIILVFMLLVGAYNKEGDFDGAFKKLKWVIGLPVLVAFFVAVIYIAGIWDYLWENVFVFNVDGGSMFGTIAFVVIVIIALVVVMWGGKSEKKEDKKEEEKK